MKTLLYYSLLQIPGLVLLGIVLAVAVQFDWLAPLWAFLIVLAWLIKDAAMYPFLKSAFEPPPAGDSGPAGLVGATGTATRELAPRGFVRVRGELWQAECVASADWPPIGPGAKGGSPGLTIAVHSQVRVVAARGMVLLVQPLVYKSEE